MKNELDIGSFAISLIEKFTEINLDRNADSSADSLKGSLAEKDLFKMPPSIENENLFDEIVRSNDFIAAKIKGVHIGFENKPFNDYKILVKTLYEKNKNSVSNDFIEKSCFTWIITAKYDIINEGRIKQDFLIYFENEISEIKKDYEISFEILNIEITKTFEIGDVKFWYMTKEYWEEKLKGKKEELEIEKISNGFAGKVLVSCKVLGKEEKVADKIAYEKCCYAMDILKTLYYSYCYPFNPIYFEIDRRCKYQASGKLAFVLEQGKDIPSAQLIFPIDREELDDNKIDWITGIQRKALADTLSSVNSNEIERLVIDSVKRFSNALSQEKVQGKIVELFTIWESLILPSDKVPIKHTLKKYVPKIICDSLEDRQRLSLFIDRMYRMRSNYIHHSILEIPTFEDLNELLKNTLNIIIRMLGVSKKIDEKKKLLKLIDEAMENSFHISDILK